MVKLKDKPNMLVSEGGQLSGGKLEYILPRNHQFSPVRPVQRTQYMEQRTFSCTGLADYADDFTVGYSQVNAFEYVQPAIRLVQLRGLNHVDRFLWCKGNDFRAVPILFLTLPAKG